MTRRRIASYALRTLSRIRSKSSLDVASLLAMTRNTMVRGRSSGRRGVGPYGGRFWHNLPRGFPRGKREKCWKKDLQSASLLGRLKSPRNMRKFLGDSLHTFSSVRKYDRPFCTSYLLSAMKLRRSFDAFRLLRMTQGRAEVVFGPYGVCDRSRRLWQTSNDSGAKETAVHAP